MSYVQEFIHWYFDEFQLTDLYQEMTKVREGSPHHQERSVATHNDMVVSYYYAKVPMNVWNVENVLGAFACAFHDVGKVRAKEEKESEERGKYYSFYGHERISARFWEDWAVKNFSMLEERFGLIPYDIYRIGWMIENHLPFKMDEWKEKKRKRFIKTLNRFFPVDRSPYFNFIIADSFGRKCTDDKNEFTTNWIRDCSQLCIAQLEEEATFQELLDYTPVLYVPIGPQGCGKSRYAENITGYAKVNSKDLHIYSWDDLRMKWYTTPEERAKDPKQAYTDAYARQLEDKDFNKKVDAEFIELVRERKNILVDNTNYTKARRAFFVEEALLRGYRTVAVLFPVTLDILRERQEARKDKFIPWNSVTRMYYGLELPQYGEFHDVFVERTNLL